MFNGDDRERCYLHLDPAKYDMHCVIKQGYSSSIIGRFTWSINQLYYQVRFVATFELSSSCVKPLSNASLQLVPVNVLSFKEKCTPEVKYLVGTMSIQMKELVVGV